MDLQTEVTTRDGNVFPPGLRKKVYV